MSAKHLKGTYNLNPTSMVMKQGSEAERAELSKPAHKVKNQSTMSEAHEAPADLDGVEHEVHSHEHPAMKTRHSHPANAKHADGRKHEDDHHAVRKLKGM